ncbi:MAG: flagellar hook-associated protein FlgK [Paracoccaceae bacterium]
MSLTSAFANATSGLFASARAVQVASSNIANAMTEGYAPREIGLAASARGGSGVRVAAVTRQVDTALLGLNREAGARAEAADTAHAFWQTIEGSIGLPGEGLSAALSGFEAALFAASERPDLTARLEAAVQSAETLVERFGDVENALQQQRMDAESTIATDIETLNAGLLRLDSINTEVIRLRAGGQSTLGLEDERQALLTTLSEIVPLRDYSRADGRVVLFTEGGQLLLDLQPAELGFSQAPIIDAQSTGLSGFTVNGRPVSSAALSGGRLGAQLAIRDTFAPQAQAALDALAQDLVTRFADPATDPGLPPGQPGLLTDAGGMPGGAIGLAGRLSVNTALAPGNAWRLRDGLAAGAPGAVGDAAQINRLIAALERPTTASPGTPQRDATGHMADFLTLVSTARDRAETGAVAATARRAELSEQAAAQGVDTDAEMQRLILIEQAYAANARVIETADAMLRRLMEI